MTEIDWLRKNNETLESILEVVKRIEKNQRGQPHHFRLDLGPFQKRQLSQGIPMPPVTIGDDEHDSITITPLDDAGNGVPFTFTPTNPVKWGSSDETIMTVSANEDGSNVDVETTGKLGVATITATGTNPDGTEVKGAQEFDVVTTTPKTFRMNVGVPQKK